MATKNMVGNGLSGASGTGAFAGNVSPSFTIPALGTPSSGNLVNCTGYPSSGIPVSTVSGTTQAMAVNNYYVANNASLVTCTLPSTAAQGARVGVIGNGSVGSWSVAQNSGQSIKIINTSTTSGVGGSLTSTNSGDAVYLVCIVPNTTWQVEGLLSQGLTVV